MNNGELNIKENKTGKIVICILSVLLIVALGYICYDKLIKSDKSVEPTPTNKPAETVVKVERIELTEENQTVNVGGKEFKIRKDSSSYLFIDDAGQTLWDIESVYADHAYVTDDFIIFTVTAQNWEAVTYAINKEGNEIAVNDYASNDELDVDQNRYQIHDLVIRNGVLEAKGQVFCGLEGNCPDEDLVVTYENNVLTFTPKK